MPGKTHAAQTASLRMWMMSEIQIAGDGNRAQQTGAALQKNPQLQLTGSMSTPADSCTLGSRLLLPITTLIKLQTACASNLRGFVRQAWNWSKGRKTDWQRRLKCKIVTQVAADCRVRAWLKEESSPTQTAKAFSRKPTPPQPIKPAPKPQTLTLRAGTTSASRSGFVCTFSLGLNLRRRLSRLIPRAA